MLHQPLLPLPGRRAPPNPAPPAPSTRRAELQSVRASSSSCRSPSSSAHPSPRSSPVLLVRQLTVAVVGAASRLMSLLCCKPGAAAHDRSYGHGRPSGDARPLRRVGRIGVGFLIGAASVVGTTSHRNKCSSSSPTSAVLQSVSPGVTSPTLIKQLT